MVFHMDVLQSILEKILSFKNFDNLSSSKLSRFASKLRSDFFRLASIFDGEFNYAIKRSKNKVLKIHNERHECFVNLIRYIFVISSSIIITFIHIMNLVYIHDSLSTKMTVQYCCLEACSQPLIAEKMRSHSEDGSGRGAGNLNGFMFGN